MVRLLFDSSRQNWNNLFSHSSHLVGEGSGRISHFQGVRPQYGTGIGGILRSLFRLVPSFLSSPIGQSLVSAGANVVNDINNGTSLKDSMKSNARSAVRNLTGVGKRRRKRRVTQKGRGAVRPIGYIRNPNLGEGSKKARKKRKSKTTPTSVIRRAFIQ